MKATAIAPSNIAFIKYWGRKDEKLRLPANGSISVNVSGLSTITTVEFNKNFKRDEIVLNNKRDAKAEKRIIKHLDRIRQEARLTDKAKVVSRNNFPTAGGLASSASGFAALTVAGSFAAGVHLSEKKLSILARQGSGSACRSIPDGFVEWLDGDTNESSYGVTIFPADYWNLVLITVIVGEEEKEVGSTEGQKLVLSNPFYPVRLSRMNEKIRYLKKLIKDKNFTEFGKLIEQEALELHAMTLTSNPSILYWQPETIKIMKLIREWRKKNIQVYFTIDSGPHPYLVCEEKNQQELVDRLQRLEGINKLIINRPSLGARLTDKHLF